ncbi:hypothetical protein [Orenia marismortui]|uniref:hypothetical protein n=1 Tax=Orenia marismortui TaxID=46469 RepID=UPI000378C39A|nr:hypothetical protein [Orenia marismortui]
MDYDNQVLIELLEPLQWKGIVTIILKAGSELSEYTGTISEIINDYYLVLIDDSERVICIPINCIYKVIYYADDHKFVVFEKILKEDTNILN